MSSTPKFDKFLTNELSSYQDKNMMKSLSMKYRRARFPSLSKIRDVRRLCVTPLILDLRSNLGDCSSRRSSLNLETKRYASRCKDNFTSVTSNTEDPSGCGSPPSLWPTGNRSGFQFHPETEAIMNKQFAVEMKAFYYYLSMAGYFGRVDVALPGCESFFIQLHHEEHGHALRFFNYIKMRGGLISLRSIDAPVDQDWKCPLNAFKAALKLELELAEKLAETNSIAEKHKDLSASDFIVTGFMEDQMKSINHIAKLVTILSGIGDQGLGRFIFDKDLLENYVTPEFNVIRKKNDENK